MNEDQSINRYDSPYALSQRIVLIDSASMPPGFSDHMAEEHPGMVRVVNVDGLSALIDEERMRQTNYSIGCTYANTDVHETTPSHLVFPPLKDMLYVNCPVSPVSGYTGEPRNRHERRAMKHRRKK